MAVDGAEAGARAAASDGTAPSWLLPLACEAPAAEEEDQDCRRDGVRGNNRVMRRKGGRFGWASIMFRHGIASVCAAASKGSPERGEEEEKGEEGGERRRKGGLVAG